MESKHTALSIIAVALIYGGYLTIAKMAEEKTRRIVKIEEEKTKIIVAEAAAKSGCVCLVRDLLTLSLSSK